MTEFFKQIATALTDKVSVLVAVSKHNEEGKIVVTLSPKGHQTFKPLTIVGTVDEMDAVVAEQVENQMKPAITAIITSKNYAKEVGEQAENEEEGLETKTDGKNKTSQIKAANKAKNKPAPQKPQPQKPTPAAETTVAPTTVSAETTQPATTEPETTTVPVDVAPKIAPAPTTQPVQGENAVGDDEEDGTMSLFN